MFQTKSRNPAAPVCTTSSHRSARLRRPETDSPSHSELGSHYTQNENGYGMPETNKRTSHKSENRAVIKYNLEETIRHSEILQLFADWVRADEDISG